MLLGVLLMVLHAWICLDVGVTALLLLQLTLSLYSQQFCEHDCVVACLCSWRC